MRVLAPFVAAASLAVAACPAPPGEGEGEGGEGEGAAGEGEGEGAVGEGEGEGAVGEGEGEGSVGHDATWNVAAPLTVQNGAIVGATFACFDGADTVFGGVMSGESVSIGLGSPPLDQPRGGFEATFLARVDATGNIVWARAIDAASVGCAVDGGALYVAGTFTGALDLDGHSASTPGSFDAGGFVAALDPLTGTATALAPFVSNNGSGSSVRVTRFAAAAGHVAIAGEFHGTFALTDVFDDNSGDAFLAILDDTLTPVASTHTGGIDSPYLYALGFAPNGDAVLAGGADEAVIYVDGTTTDVSPAQRPLYAVRLAVDGTVTGAAHGIHDDCCQFFSMRDMTGTLAADGTAFVAVDMTDPDDGTAFGVVVDPPNFHGAIGIYHLDAGVAGALVDGHAFPYEGSRLLFRGLALASNGDVVLALVATLQSLDLGAGPFPIGSFQADDALLAHFKPDYTLRFARVYTDVDVSGLAARSTDDALFFAGTYSVFTDAGLDLGLGALPDFGPNAFDTFTALLAPL